MDLRGKLQRWGPAWAAREGIKLEGESSPASSLEETQSLSSEAAAESDESALASPLIIEPPSEVGRGPVPAHIVQLRERLFDTIGRSLTRLGSPTKKPEVEHDAVDVHARVLPFDVTETPQGPRWVRSEVYDEHYAIGRQRVGTIVAQMGGCSDILASLSLDRSLADVDPTGALFFDVESTGLAGGTGTVPFLIGLSWFEDDGEGGRRLAFEQLLLPEFGQETPMLERLSERMARATLLVSFNGKSFDLPLLRTRCVLSRVPTAAALPHFDLLHVARRVHRLKSAALSAPDEAETSCRLVALERKILGLVRDDDVPSAEVPSRYRRWLHSRDLRVLTAVCEHNRWDVLAMAGLMARYVEGVRALAGDHPWSARDLVGLARTLRRAGDLSKADLAGDKARVAAIGGAWDPTLDIALHHERALLAKRRGNIEEAIRAFDHLAREHDDPAARLELSKLYEHRLDQPERALDVVREGVDEDAEAVRRRIERLERKVTRPRQLSLYDDGSTSAGPRTRVGRRS